MPKMIMKPESMQFARIIEKATIRVTNKAVNTDWFASNVSPTNAPANHRIYILLATTSVVNLQMNDGINSNITMNLNGGTALTADSLYAFDIIVPDGYSYNIHHKTGTQNISGWIVESGALS